jgi:quinoprotein glucose dehydrogenase
MPTVVSPDLLPQKFCLVLTTSLFATFLLAAVVCAQTGARDGQWRYHGADSGSSKCSSLTEINEQNVRNLRIVWRWSSPDSEITRQTRLVPFVFEATPLMINGVLYVSTSFSLAAAIDGASGKTKWIYDSKSYLSGKPPNNGFVHRGVAYWTDGKDERIFLGTGGANLVALEAKTGKPCLDFGEKGKIDLTKGLRRPVRRQDYSVPSPPIICRDVVVVGCSISDGPMNPEMPPGDVRGFDVRSGKLLWTFHSVPQEGEFGNETWQDRSWKYSGNTNVWTLMSADEELGYVYLPFGAPTNDWYGGHRPGDNLFGDSLVCLEAGTGRRVWHFQAVHHGLWDYDLPAAPNLVNITVNGKEIKAVAQVTKQGFCFVFDRTTGKPVWPIDERPVPQSRIPGEKTSPTQPFPSKPPPFERQGVTIGDLIDFTPELRQQAIAILERYQYGPLFTPPSEKGTINLPGWGGGANWRGAALDPETGILYVPSIMVPVHVKVEKPDSKVSEFRFMRKGPTAVPGPQGLPLIKPPYSRITAIDLNKGELRWMIPLGDGPRNHPLLKPLNLPPLGSRGLGALLLTKTLLFAGEGGAVADHANTVDPRSEVEGVRPSEPKLRILDKATGKQIWEMSLPAHINGGPMTYTIGTKQYIVTAIGGGSERAELVALSLP